MLTQKEAFQKAFLPHKFYLERQIRVIISNDN